MKKLLRTVLVLIVAVAGWFTKTYLNEGGDAGGTTSAGTEVLEETASRNGDVDRPVDLPRDSDAGSGDVERPRSLPDGSTNGDDRGGDVERPRTLPRDTEPEPAPPAEPAPVRVDRRGESAIMNAFRAQRSDVQINFTGKIKFMLPYDDKPPRHQQWVMELSNGHTIKVAHNTDLAPQVPNLGKGDTVTVYGEYEYNEKGGVIHWTHHDPRKRHIGGYVQFEGKKYE